MIPAIIMTIAQMAQKKGQNEAADIQKFNEQNTQNLLGNGQQQQQLPQFNTDMDKMFHS